jgi:DNA-binding response OmpR family regulator
MATRTPLSSINVLLIDNDAKLANLEKNILLTFGFRDVDVVGDGDEALERMYSKHYDLILCDWEMDRMKGVELVHFIRNNADSPDPFVPIIMVTGRAERADVIEARDVGITEFLAKPFSVEDLRKRIIEVVERPRPFIILKDFHGPDRRRIKLDPPGGIERCKNDKGN